jgi:hypothetical protein
LEAAVVDHSEMTIKALEPGDDRSLRAQVAGVAALFVAKLHELHDRLVVDHSSLDPCFRMKLGECATVYDGSFSLAETSPTLELITGQFAGGSPPTNQIQLLNRGDNCTDQLFKITDALVNVGTGSQRSSWGSSFVGYLWHHQRSFWGRCITYAATVQGTVVLNF